MPSIALQNNGIEIRKRGSLGGSAKRRFAVAAQRRLQRVPLPESWNGTKICDGGNDMKLEMKGISKLFGQAYALK
ncbi:MAG: hypothetical protein Q4D43_09915, partial [Clostridia bacterium]|nr:hypothetical protein [Clostridia bacterium]